MFDRRNDDEPQLLNAGKPMRRVRVGDHLVVTNPWRMALWMEPSARTLLLDPDQTDPSATWFEAVNGEVHGLIRDVDDRLAGLLAADPGIPETLSSLEVHGVSRNRLDNGIFTAAGFANILRIQCPLKIRVTRFEDVGVAAFAALPPRTDVRIEAYVSKADSVVLPPGWSERVRLRPYGMRPNRPMVVEPYKPMDYGDNKELADILRRIDAVLSEGLTLPEPLPP